MVCSKGAFLFTKRKEEYTDGDSLTRFLYHHRLQAQLMASEYKKRGGSYTTDKETGQDESQKHLSQWTEEEWQTKEGNANAAKDNGTRKRYLPKKAWEAMSEDEKEETEARKEEGEKQGKQFAENTERAKEERKKASKGT